MHLISLQNENLNAMLPQGRPWLSGIAQLYLVYIRMRSTYL